MRQLLLAALAAALAIALLIAAAAAFGHDPLTLLGVLTRGSIGTRFALEGTIVKTIPLLLTGLAIAVAFRAGVWNIGAEGQFIAGALAAFATSRWGLPASIAAGIAAGAGWASLATLLRLRRGAPEVLTTILLNFAAIHLLGWCVNGPMRERSAQYPQTDLTSVRLPQIAGFHGGIAIALAAALVIWWLMQRTSTGLRLRAIGFNPEAAAWAGVDVRRHIAVAMATSGALAGLAGAVELLGVTGRLFERFAAGYGYSAIAVALLAHLHPLATIASALFFGALATGSGELQRSANVSSAVAVLAQASVILFLLLFARLERRRWST